MSNQSILELGQKYVMNTYGRLPFALVEGKGTKVWDADGKEYIDFVAGLAVNALGHCHPVVTEAIREQAGKLVHCSNLYWIEPQVQLAQLLVENSCLDKVFFANSGAEANEAAIKLARKFAKLHYGEQKYEIITMRQSFHGRTLATLTATAQEKFHKGFAPLPEGFKYVPFNDYDSLAALVNEHTCAIMMEPIQGEGGVYAAQGDYLHKVKKLCQEKGILLIFDEVQCGMGRTGKLFAYEHFGVEPDIMTLAKALGGGVAIGAMLAKDKVAAAFQPGDHASTFGGNPLAMAAGLAATKIIADGKFLAKVQETGAYFKNKLELLAQKFSFIQEVRGEGLILGVELTIPGGDIVNSCLEKGLLINCTNQTVLRFLPPLIVEKTEVEQTVEILSQSLNEVQEG
ncbi:acetylornithine transaminase [Bacillota bacterium LX-D]|nr:acetylornithine transaminase [Bacillota bacterium LX-D]